MSAESTNAFELFGEVGVDLTSFDKAMDAADARLSASSKTMGQTGTAADRMAARINAASQSLAKMRDDARQAETEAKKLGTVTKEDAEHFARLNASLDKADQALARTRQEFNQNGEATKTASGHVLNLENKVKACERALRGETTALKDSGDAADQTAKKHERLADRVGQLASGMTSVGVAMTAGITAPLIGIGSLAVKTASDVQSSVANISTIKPEIDTSRLYSQLNDLQTKVPYTASQLGEALYDIFGTIDVDQNGGVRLLEKFSKGATAARTDAQIFGSAMMGMMGAFGKSVDDADSVMDVFFNTVNRASNVTGSQLAPELGKVSAMASKAGVSMEELGALIVASSKGGGVASENINNVANMLQKLPMPEARKQLKALGVDLVDAGGKFRPILTVLGELKNKMKGLSEGDKATALSAIFPDAQAQVGISTVMKFLDDADKALAENRSQTDSTAKAWDRMSATLTVQATLLKNSVLNALGQIGEQMLPILAPAVTWLSQNIPQAVALIIHAFQSLPSSVQGVSVAFVAALAIIGPVMAALGVVIAGVAAIGGTLTLALAAVTAEIAVFAAAATAGAMLIYDGWKNNFGGVRDFTTKVWADIKAGLSEFVSYFENLWATYGEEIKNTFFEAWNAIRAFFEPTVRDLVKILSYAWDTMVAATKAAWPYVKTIVEGALSTLLAVIRTGTAILNGDWARAWTQFGLLAMKAQDVMVNLASLILTALAHLASAAYVAATDVGKRIVAGIISGITGSNGAGQIAAAMFGLIVGAGSSAQSVAAQQGAAAGNAYRSALAASMGGGGGGGSIVSLFGMGGGGGGGGQKATTASAGPWAAGVTPGTDYSAPKSAPRTSLPAGMGGGKKGGGGGGGSKGNNSEADAEIKMAELSLRGAERLYSEGSNIIKSLYDFRKISMAQLVAGEIAEEERLLGKKLEVIQKERDAAEKLKGPARKVKLKESDENANDARSGFEQKRMQANDELAKMNEERERARQETLYQILQNGEAAKLSAVQSAGNLRVSTAEQIARRISEIEQEQLNNEEAYLNRQLNDANANEKAQSDIKNKLALLEVRRGHATEESDRQIAEARRRDLADYRAYSDQLADLINTNLENEIGSKRMRLDHASLFITDKKKLLKAEIALDLEQEDARHARALDAIERERREFAERKHTFAQWLEFKKQYQKQLDDEDQRHLDEQQAARDKETQAQIDRLKSIADKTGDIFGRAIDAGVKGGFAAAFRSIATDFASLLRDLGLQLLKSYFLKLLMSVMKIPAGGVQSQGSGSGTTAGSTGGGWKSIFGGILGGIFGSGGANNGSNTTTKDSTTNAVETVGKQQIDATIGGTGSTTDEIKTQGDQSNGMLGGILGTNQNMLGALNSLAAGIITPAWAGVAKAALALGQAALASKSAKGGGGESGGGGGNPGRMATGGFVAGAGTSTSDSVPMMLSTGEYVINAASVKRFGKSYFDSINFNTSPKLASRSYVPSSNSSSNSSGSMQRGNSINVQMTVNANDVQSFNRSRAQIARDLAGELSRQHHRLG